MRIWIIRRARVLKCELRWNRKIFLHNFLSSSKSTLNQSTFLWILSLWVKPRDVTIRFSFKVFFLFLLFWYLGIIFMSIHFPFFFLFFYFMMIVSVILILNSSRLIQTQSILADTILKLGDLGAILSFWKERTLVFLFMSKNLSS